MSNVFAKIAITLLVLLLANVSSARSVLPVIKISGDFGDEYTKGKIIIFDTDSQKVHTYDMYAKYRGASSKNYDKKSFAVKLVDSNDEKLSASLLGMRNDNSWILDAMAVDRSRMRNRVAFDIWNAMNVKPYYHEKEPKARTGIEGRFVELIVNDDYHGIYCLNEKIDRKQLKLKKMKGDEVRGVLYKGKGGGCTLYSDPEEYDNESPTYKSFESSYPDVDDCGFTEWGPFVEMEEFLMHSSDNDFREQYKNRFDVPVLINLHILINSIGSMDNSGKNQFFYIYDITDDKKMSFAPWDMDSSFGRSWDASVFSCAYDVTLYENHIITKINALDTTFMDSIAKRYFELRKTVLATDSIRSRFENYYKLFYESGAALRECRRWNKVDLTLSMAQEKEFIYRYIDYRMDWLDEYYTLTHNPNRNTNPICYDIFGRRTYDISKGNFYIIDGKKFFIKK